MTSLVVIEAEVMVRAYRPIQCLFFGMTFIHTLITAHLLYELATPPYLISILHARQLILCSSEAGGYDRLATADSIGFGHSAGVLQDAIARIGCQRPKSLLRLILERLTLS